ncbi:hypothetical protein Tco_0684950 [Tanacetum coccineum]|uniref:Uncharacterized protein n=1 Tax=Tanacetum coccineum TaxID=301880 RepID=A0ABQ5F557_9ASTR
MWDDMARKFDMSSVESMEGPVIIVVSSCRLSASSESHCYFNLDILKANRSRAKYKYDLNPSVDIRKYRLEDPDNDRLRNIYSSVLFLQKKPDTYKLKTPDPHQIQAEVLAIEGSKQKFWFHFNTLIKIGTVDFTQDFMLNEAIEANTPKPGNDLTATLPSLELAKLEDTGKKVEGIMGWVLFGVRINHMELELKGIGDDDEPERIMCNQTTAFTSSLHGNVEGSHRCTLNMTMQAEMRNKLLNEKR